MKQLFLYSIASSFGFVVDLCAFVLLSQWLHIYPARLFAFLLSIAFTYEINNRITFTGNGKRWLYVLGQCKGFLINFGLFVWISQALNALAWGDYIAFALGCFAALLFNFFFARRFVFGNQ